MYISRQKLQFTEFILIYFIYLLFFCLFSAYILFFRKEDFVVISTFLMLHNIMSSEDTC